jgi:hypothetical protein
VEDEMPINDPDFLSSPTKQLRAVQELATLRTRILDLETELLRRKHERRALIERLSEQDLSEQAQGGGRTSRTAARERARASREVRDFDENMRSLAERIRRLAIDAEKYRLSIDVAVAERTRGRGEGAAVRIA